MDDNPRFNLAEEIVSAIDRALDAGLSRQLIEDEFRYQLENYDWDA